MFSSALEMKNQKFIDTIVELLALILTTAGICPIVASWTDANVTRAQ
jgi:hypothetical protein